MKHIFIKQTQLLLFISGMNLHTSPGLQCYNCTTKWEFDACVLHPNQTNFITCETHQNVCMVWRHKCAWMSICNDIRYIGITTTSRDIETNNSCRFQYKFQCSETWTLNLRGFFHIKLCEQNLVCKNIYNLMLMIQFRKYMYFSNLLRWNQ